MPDIDLSQAEADALIAMEKVRINDDPWVYPPLGGAISIPLTSNDKRESFHLDVSRGQIELLKAKYQNRARQVVVLLRFDSGGSPHRNPDGQEVPCPHLHIYREGYGDKWAIPAPSDPFANVSDLWQTLCDFMRYCHITRPPIIPRGLFT
jgi:hypothetical protein